MRLATSTGANYDKDQTVVESSTELRRSDKALCEQIRKGPDRRNGVIRMAHRLVERCWAGAAIRKKLLDLVGDNIAVSPFENGIDLREEIPGIVRQALRVPKEPRKAPQPARGTRAKSPRRNSAPEIGTNHATLRDIAEKKLEPIVPIIRDFLYPGAWLFVGRSKIGKSWLFLQLALKFAEQGNFLGYECVSKDAEVLYFALEDSEHRIHDRLKDLGVIDNVPFGCRIILGDEFKKIAAQHADDDMSFYEYLDRYLENCPQIRLVLVDTEVTALQLWKGGMDPDGGKPTDKDYLQGRGFDDIALRRNAAILLGNHSGKRKAYTVDYHERINRTNVALAGVSGSIVLDDLPKKDTNDPEERHRIFAVRGRDLKTDIQLMVHLDANPHPPWWIVDGPYVEVTQTRLEEEIFKTVHSLMPEAADEYVSVQDVAEFLACSRSNIKNAVHRMLKRGRYLWNGYRFVSKPGPKGGYRLKRESQ